MSNTIHFFATTVKSDFATIPEARSERGRPKKLGKSEFF
jgi:hypothetical protein